MKNLFNLVINIILFGTTHFTHPSARSKQAVERGTRTYILKTLTIILILRISGASFYGIM